MPSSAVNSVLARNGTGKWKSWTPEAIQRAAHALNPATKALSFLTDMVLDTVQVAAWGPLFGMYGTVLLWPQARLPATRRTLFTAMGQL